MSKNNPLNFTTKDAVFATCLKVLERNSKSKCWIQVKNTENALMQHILFQYYRNPNQQINDLVKVAIVNGYNKLIIDNGYRNADGVIDNTLDLITVADVKLTWDQHAGCSKCGCNPGYKVSFNSKLNIRSDIKYNADIYVDLFPKLVDFEIAASVSLDNLPNVMADCDVDLHLFRKD